MLPDELELLDELLEEELLDDELLEEELDDELLDDEEELVEADEDALDEPPPQPDRLKTTTHRPTTARVIRIGVMNNIDQPLSAVFI